MNKKITAAVCGALAVSCIVTVPILNSKGVFSDGNSEKYSIANTAADENSPLKGKKIIFLGSSVTFGSASKEESFVEFLAKKDGVIPVKEAVSGTTLVDNGDDSYIARMKTIDTGIEADAFICQLSTNDATKKLPVGEIADGFDMNSLDTQTVAGAIEYVIAYAKQTWSCPVIFYTGTQYDSEQYEQLVSLLLDIQKKWDIGVIDLWNNPMNNIPKEKYNLYMANGIHPTRAGYREWWLPEFEKYLFNNL